MKYLILTKKLLIQEYLKNYLSANKIAQKINIKLNKIYYWLDKYKIKKRKTTDYNKKGKNNPNYKNGWTLIINRCTDCGIKIYPKAIRCLSCSKILYFNIPENNPHYIDGRSFKKYPKIFNERLKNKIRKKNNYICQLCHLHQNLHITLFNQLLHIHHIDYNKENCSETNLVTLCKPCNTFVNQNRSFWIKYFKSKDRKQYKRIFIDLDGVLCENTFGKYNLAKPIIENIKKINELFKQGKNIIIIWTSRGKTTSKDWSQLTLKQLKKWKVKYHILKFDKMSYDILICDKAINSKTFFRGEKYENKM